MPSNKPSKTLLKHQAQDKLIHGMQAAFTSAGDEGASQEVIDEMSEQFRRIEKMFGYAPGSCSRGV